MNKVALVALSLLASSAYAIPPGIPPKFDGMAEVRTGVDSACQGIAPFTFSADGNRIGFRVTFTLPPCLKKFALQELVQIEPTPRGTLWLVTVRAGDPGNDDGPLFYLIPGDPVIQEQLALAPNEVATYRVSGVRLDASHFQVRYRLVP